MNKLLTNLFDSKLPTNQVDFVKLCQNEDNDKDGFKLFTNATHNSTVKDAGLSGTYI